MANHRVSLLEGPVGSTLLKLAGPLAIGLVAVILFNVVDTFWVGRLGATELAAMSFTFPVVFLIMSIAMGMGIGVTAVVSRVIGAGDSDQVCRLTTDGLLLANAMVVVMALVGLASIDPVFRLLGAPPDIVALIRQYMIPYYIGVGFIVIPMTGNAAIRATGDTRTPSMIMIIAGGVNIVLDPLLIFGIGPFPRLELQGAAVATVISYMVTFFAAFWILWKRERMLEFSRPRVRDVLDSWSRILYIGAPAAGTQMLVPLGAGILTRIVSGFGPEAVAAFGVGTRIESLSLIGPMALASSFAPFVGQNLGARNYQRIRRGLRFSLLTGLVYGAVMAVVLALLARSIASVFTEESDVVELVVRYLSIVPVSYGLFGGMFAVNATFNASNHPLRAALVISFRLFVLAVPLAWLGAMWSGATGVFGGIAVANIVIGLIAILMARSFLRDVEKKLATEIDEKTPQ